MDDLGRDVLDLLDRLRVGRFCYAGVSMGGMIGMWLGINAPDRVERLVLCSTTAKFPSPDPWIERAAKVRREGTGSIAATVVARWFTPSFAQSHPDLVERFQAGLSGVDDEGYAGCCDALSTMDFAADLAEIIAPTVVVAAANDT